MKTRFIILILLIFPVSVFSQASSITVTWIKDSKEITIYSGNQYENIGKLISKAKPVNQQRLEKECVVEGEYRININENTYEVINRYWIYNETEDLFLRCNLLDDCREFLIRYLLQQNIYGSL